MSEVDSHPVRLTVSDDLERTRLTVFFRLLLAIPHFIWLALWGIAALVVAILNWFATLFGGRSPEAFHNFLSAYIRYSAHVSAYFQLAANPFPGFLGEPNSYPIDVQIAGPERQNRWITGFRVILAIPALLVASALAGGLNGSFGGGTYVYSGGLASVVAFLGWFVCMARARMPSGFRNAIAYGIGYSAQAFSYAVLLTDRYPNADPFGLLEEDPVEHPVRLHSTDDLRRSRLTVFFRALLAVPHFIWLVLWGIAAFVAGLVNGIAVLIRGRAPDGLHRFLTAYVRYYIHVNAFLFLAANPFPGFLGQPGTYPVDAEFDAPAEQNRWITFFRIFLSIPAILVEAALTGLLAAGAILGWFASLFTATMPRGLRNAELYALRYVAQVNAYFYVLTDRYPYTGPTVPVTASSESRASLP